MAYTLLSLIFKVFFLVAAAYVLCRRGVLTAQDRKSLTTVLMKLVVFFTVLMSSQQELSPSAVQAILITGLFAVISYAVVIPVSMLLGKLLRPEEKKRRVFVCSIVFCNTAFVGYPILQELYGNVGLLCGITYNMVYNVVFFTWGMSYLGGGGRMSLRSLLTNKVAVVSLLALVMYFFQIRIPDPFFSTFSSIGAATMPLSMLIIGCHLAESGIRKIIREKELYLATALRMLVVPAIVFLSMRMLGIDPMIVKITTVIAALPAGTMTTIVASEYDCAPDYAANIMVQTMLAMTLTLPLWVLVLGL